MKRDILYVDDEPDNIVVFEAAFEDEFNVLTASSGQQALEILERVAVPVVVADQRMPEMTGVELFRIMRSRYPYIQRIILTGYSDPDAMMAAINQGQVFHFVMKPWERHMLLSVLIRSLEAHDLSVANNALTNRLVVSERGALLGRATARLAHEIGNQLCMLPLIEFIETEYADQDELVRIARFARETYNRLLGLIQEVKSFMRFEHEQFERTPISTAEIVHELVAFLRFDKTVPAERIQVDVREDAVILGHKVKLQQVLVNLIKNAVHAVRDRQDGRVRLTVDRDDHRQALLSVSDNGHGMSPETQSRIWEPYFTTKGSEGNGLGLDISKRLVEGHGGEITCESTPGAGTTFLIRLPAADPCLSHSDEPDPESRIHNPESRIPDLCPVTSDL